MTAREFCYWLQGYFEITDANPPVDGRGGLTPHQADRVRRHLAMVFAHEIDPAAGPPDHQTLLNTLHKTPASKMFTAPDGSTPRC